MASQQQGLYPAADTVGAQLRFASGVVGTGSWCFVVGKAAAEEYGEITGTRGKVRFHFFTSSAVTLTNETGRFEFDLPHPQVVQEPLIRTVVGFLRGQEECPSTGQTALSTSYLLDTIMGGPRWG